MRKKYFIGFLSLTFFCMSSSYAGEVKSVEEHSFKIRRGGYISLVGDDGYIKINSWNKPEVSLKITKRVWARDRKRANELLDEVKIDIKQSGDRLDIREPDLGDHFRFSNIFHSDKWRRHFELQVDYDLMVPENINLDLENDEGNIEITKITGRLTVQIDEGDIMLSDSGPLEIDIRIDEGDLVCKNILGANSTLDVNLDEGSVRLSNAEFSTVDLTSDEGDFILDQLIMKDGEFLSDEGDIEADMRLLAGGRCRIRTDEGDVFVRIPEDNAVQLRFEAREGRIRSDFPVSIRRWGDDGEKLDAVLGQNEAMAQLSVYTEEGSIILKNRR